MATIALTPKQMQELQEHGHLVFWVVTLCYKPGTELLDSISVDCSRCGEVLIDLFERTEKDEEVQASVRRRRSAVDKTAGKRSR